VAGVKPREATAEGGLGLTPVGPTVGTISERMGDNVPSRTRAPRRGYRPASLLSLTIGRKFTAAQRCAEGAGLDGGDCGRSTIKDALRRATARTQLHRSFGSDRHFDHITKLHQLDGRDRAVSGAEVANQQSKGRSATCAPEHPVRREKVQLHPQCDRRIAA